MFTGEVIQPMNTGVVYDFPFGHNASSTLLFDNTFTAFV